MGAMLRLFPRLPFVDADERRQVRGAREGSLLLGIWKGLTKNSGGAIPAAAVAAVKTR